MAGGRPDTLEWRRSISCESGACVEVASLGELIAVRDSRNPDGVILTFRHSAWRDFIADVRAGEYEAGG